MERNDKREITCEIKEEFGVIAEDRRGWHKELNLVSWNHLNPKYDIREWSPDRSRMGKGVTFTKDEIVVLRNLLNDLVI